nr:maco-A 28 [Mamestra configurata nucleopolyhedrovirus A]
MTVKLQQNFKSILMKPELDQHHGILEKMKRVEPIVYEEICYIHSLGIPGIVAGGFAAFLLGYTSEYGDVDFFCENIDAVGLLQTMKNRYDVKYQSCKSTCIILNNVKCNLQVICIESELFKGVDYYNELVSDFDLPICQRGFFLIHPDLVRNKSITNSLDDSIFVIQHYNYKIMQRESIKHNNSKRTTRRLKKYAQRTLTHGSPPTLRLMCQSALRNFDPNYKPIRLPSYY